MTSDQLFVLPDFTGLSSLVDFKDSLVYDSLVSSTLEGVASNVSLGDTNVAIPGRLLGCVDVYVEANASAYTVDTIKEVYKLMFINDEPPRAIRPNNTFALSKPTFLLEELIGLEEFGCTKRAVFQPHVVNPSSVVYSKKWTCVLDASICLNKYCVHRKTRFSDLSCIPLLLKKGDYMMVHINL